MARDKMKKHQKVPMKKKKKNLKTGNPNKWRPEFPMEKVYIEHTILGHTLIQINSRKLCYIKINLMNKDYSEYITVSDDGTYYSQIIESNVKIKLRNHIRKTAWLTKQQKKDFYTAIDDYYDLHYLEHLKWKRKKGLA